MTALSTQFQFIINTGSFTSTSVSIPSAAVAPDGSNNFYSISQPGDGYYSLSDGLHTVTYTVNSAFQGNIGMQATLATEPQTYDWFTVTNTVIAYTANTASGLTTTTNYVNFTGNFVYVRATVQRVANDGTVNFINYNH